MKELCYKYADYVSLKLKELNKNRKKEGKDDIVISSKRIQKILFFASVIFARENNGEKLFLDDFFDWYYGPSLPDLHSRYTLITRVSKNNTLTVNEWENINPKEKYALDLAVDLAGELTLKELTDKTHAENTPWKKRYTEGKTFVIPFFEIYDFYKKDSNYIFLIS